MPKIKSQAKGTTVHRKKNGAAYLYAFESYWDKEKKQARNKQVCLGRINEETGEAIPSGRRKRANEEIQKHRKRYAGFFCILTNSSKNGTR